MAFAMMPPVTGKRVIAMPTRQGLVVCELADNLEKLTNLMPT